MKKTKLLLLFAVTIGLIWFAQYAIISTDIIITRVVKASKLPSNSYRINGLLVMRNHARKINQNLRSNVGKSSTRKWYDLE